MKQWLLVLTVCAASHSIQAQSTKQAQSSKASSTFQDHLYVGGGLSRNDLGSFDDATGYQFFAGYNLGYKIGEIGASTAVEIGYMDSGDFDQNVFVPIFGQDARFTYSAKGLWATSLLRLPLNSTVDLIGRAGIDIGDDDGFMFGGGIEFNASKQWGVRLEFVSRDEVDSLQANFVYYPQR